MNATPHSTTITPTFVPFLAVPRDRGDEACAVLSPIAFKLWYHIARMTRGWQREEATISYQAFKRACGIKGNQTITNALRELVSKGFIRVRKGAGWRGASVYALLDAAGQPVAPLKQAQPARAAPRGAWQPQPSSPLGGPAICRQPRPVPARQPAPQAAPAQREEDMGTPSQELTELRQRLAELTEEMTSAYLLMVRSDYGTSEYTGCKLRLGRLRLEQRRLRVEIDALGEE